MTAISMLSALAQPTRLAVLGTLVEAGEEGVTAGALAERTGTPANTMSAHLAILTKAGFATSRRKGRNIVYTAEPGAVQELVDFLLREFTHNGQAGRT